MKRCAKLAGLAALLALAAAAPGCRTPDAREAAGAALAPVLSCEPVGRARPVCGFQNPEDLVALPGGRAVLVSEYGAMQGGRAGDLALFELESERRRVLFRGGDASGPATWGDPSCPGPPPPEFSPHGIHLSRRSDGALQLLVVQHGGRESIELFEVTGSGVDFEVTWRGCVPAPADAWLNSVAALPEGGFVTTHMLPRTQREEDMAAAFSAGEPTGHVLEWRPGRAFRVVPGTETALPNGIEVSPDGRAIFLNSSGAGELCRIERDGTDRRCVAIPGLDNARWAPDGRLLVASILSVSMEEFAVCSELERGACPVEFQIVAVHPDTLETEVLYRNRGAPMGGGTVGLMVGDELLIGSFAGDRILRVALD